jgi:hypothetical protein
MRRGQAVLTAELKLADGGESAVKDLPPAGELELAAGR